MKKLITLITLALTVSVTSAQSNQDSLNTASQADLSIVKSDLRSLTSDIQDLSQELAKTKKQQQDALNKLNSESKNAIRDSLEDLEENLRKEWKRVQSSLQQSIARERKKAEAQTIIIDSLQTELTGGLTMIDSEVDGLSSSLTATNEQLDVVKENGDLNNKTTHEYLMYLMVAICVLLLLVIVVYWLTHKKHGNVSSDLVDAKADLKAQINTANADFAEKLAKTLSELPKPAEGGDKPGPADNQGLILDFAQQIASMENNIWHLPEGDRVRKRIEKATQKMRNTFKSLGYDMPNLLGTEILDGQAVDIGDSNEDSSIEPGKKVVSKVVKPQVLFNGKTIQRPKFDIIENTED